MHHYLFKFCILDVLLGNPKERTADVEIQIHECAWQDLRKSRDCEEWRGWAG